MPFNAAMVAGGGGRVITLAALDAEDLTMLYDVENQLLLQFPQLGASQPGDIINLTLGGHQFVAALANNYALDADGLHDDAKLVLTFSSGCHIRGRGGAAGRGGWGDFESQQDGSPGLDGGIAIRLGCPTDLRGGGNIRTGYGGGGGGAGAFIFNGGGCGGGGGAPFGLGASGSYHNGTNGDAATLEFGGLGGDNPSGGDGGNGGNNGSLPKRGDNTTGGLGGEPGLDGSAMDTQGFSYDADPGVNFIGDII